MQTTLNKIRKHYPCSSGWHTLLKGLNKAEADDEPLLLSRILEINGIDDTVWAFCAVKGHYREMRLFAVWCARQVAHLCNDPRITQTLDVATRYAGGKASGVELLVAQEAAHDVARAGGGAVEVAAYTAARAAFYAAHTDIHTAAYVARTNAGHAGQDNAAQTAELRRVLSEIEEGRDPYSKQTKEAQP